MMRVTHSLLMITVGIGAASPLHRDLQCSSSLLNAGAAY